MILQGFNYCLYPRSSWRKVAGKCLQCSSVLIWSVGIWSLEVGKLLAADNNSVLLQAEESNALPFLTPFAKAGLIHFPEVSPEFKLRAHSSSPLKWTKKHPISCSRLKPTLAMSQGINSLADLERMNQLCLSKGGQVGMEKEQGELALPNTNSTASVELHYPLKPPLMQLAAPENFNPGLRLPPPQPQPSVQPMPTPTSTEPATEALKLESLTTDFRRDADNFDQRNLFIEETAQFRLRNGNRFRIKTGFNSFEQRNVESITNIPLHVEWEGKINQVTVAVGGGVDVFDRLPTAVNFNAKVEAPFAMKVSPSGQLQSGVVVSANVEQGPYKSNAETLNNQITAWRFGPSLYWQIDRNTSLYSSLRLGSYNDGNFEQQSFSRVERKFGQFFVAANVFNWNYRRDVEKTSGYFSPPDFLVYNGEVGWEGNIVESLRCRIAANLGQQRLEGEWDIANSYQARCTAKLSPNVEADFGYAYSNVQNRQTEGSGYNNQSFTGQLRVKF